jgi:hypothetical protein
MTVANETDVYYDPFDPAINADPHPTLRGSDCMPVHISSSTKG